MLYWRIGKEILERQAAQAWGTKVIEKLAKGLKSEFPDMKGLSRTNLLYMRAFANAWHDEAIVQQLAGQLPWFHNCTNIDQVKDRSTREWYVKKTIENGPHGNTRNQLRQVFDALRELTVAPEPPKRPIGFVHPPKNKA